MTYCFLRHAEQNNEGGSLTPLGRLQAQNLQLPDFDIIFSSPAKRSYETAHLIAPLQEIQVLEDLYIPTAAISPELLQLILQEIALKKASSVLIVSHAGVSNYLAAACFPLFAEKILNYNLGHAEGFLIQEESLSFVSPLL